MGVNGVIKTGIGRVEIRVKRCVVEHLRFPTQARDAHPGTVRGDPSEAPAPVIYGNGHSRPEQRDRGRQRRNVLSGKGVLYIDDRNSAQASSSDVTSLIRLAKNGHPAPEAPPSVIYDNEHFRPEQREEASRCLGRETEGFHAPAKVYRQGGPVGNLLFHRSIRRFRLILAGTS